MGQRLIEQETMKAVEMAAMSLPFIEAVAYLQSVMDGSYQFNYRYAIGLAKENPQTTLGVTCVHIDGSCEFGSYTGSF